ncbi:MAG: stage V sporulation protein AB [Firmicutes bacterium]|nr:stage V sporulation protein AB [Bacillota bacterium]
MEILKYLLAVLIGVGSGLVVSGAVFAFITIVGVVPRLAQKTKTERHIKVYESAIVLGGFFGTLTGVIGFTLPIGSAPVVAVSLANGVFFGALAMSLAEVLNVIPILTRRGRLQHGMFYFVMAIALGKFVGALLYFLVPGFYDAGNM